MNNDRRQRDPLPGVAVARARAVLGELGLKHPTEIEIEAIAHARGALVRAAPTRGARANLLRMGDRAIISVDDLPTDQRRWAIAHELGHFEVHPDVSYLGFCTGEDLRADYHRSGREPEANAFAAELLMPETLFQRAVDKVTKPAWREVQAIATGFQVSLTAAAHRFIELSWERVALFISRDGKVVSNRGRRDFGTRRKNGEALDTGSLAHDYFTKKKVWPGAQHVSAQAWSPSARDSAEVMEELFVMDAYGSVLSLVWWPA
ncbi:MAG: ImmA/IrrE family metallo-endopeptidase [Kofleriaceae bacterium]